MALGYHILPFIATVLKLFYTIFHTFWAKIRKNRHIFHLLLNDIWFFLPSHRAFFIAACFFAFWAGSGIFIFLRATHSSQKVAFCQNSHNLGCLISYAFNPLSSIFVTPFATFLLLFTKPFVPFARMLFKRKTARPGWWLPVYGAGCFSLFSLIYGARCRFYTSSKSTLPAEMETPISFTLT